MAGKARQETRCLFTAEAARPYSAVYPAMKMKLTLLNCWLAEETRQAAVATKADGAELPLAWLHPSPVLFLMTGAVLAILLTSTCSLCLMLPLLTN